MKLECVYSEDQGKHPTFIVGKEYEVYDTESDEADEPIGYFYECDKEGLLERIKEKKS